MAVTQEIVGALHRGEVIRVNLNPTQESEQVRTLDLSQCWWRSTKEYLPATVVDQVVATLNLIIGG